MKIDEKVLDAKLTELEEARQWSARVVSKLEMMIRTADDYDLFRINPFHFATEKEVVEGEALDLFLYGSKAGLFDMDWHLVCAFCSHIFRSFRELSRVYSHFICDFCHAENFPSLDDYIHVTFTIAPSVRPIAYHDPAQLSIEDFYYKYHFSKGVKPFEGGVTLDGFLRASTRLLTYLEPHETLTAELDTPAGMLSGSDLGNSSSFTLFVSEESSASAQSVELRLVDGEFEAIDPMLEEQTIDKGLAVFVYENSGEFESGKITIEIENMMDERSSVFIIYYPPGIKPWYMEFEPFLSGKQLLSTQTFRELFRDEVIGEEEGLSVKNLTYLFTDLKDSTAMYDQIGDPKAYNLVRLHFDTIGRVVAENTGAIVKTIGDAIMASFVNPVHAIHAAIHMLTELETFNEDLADELILKIGIHNGHSIAVTLNNRIDYFGQNVNIAARIQQLAGAREIYISEDIYQSPGVAEVIESHEVTQEEGIMKGISEKISVYKVTLSEQET